MSLKELRIADYAYHLPEDKIALHPLENRHDSKLLVFANGEIQDHSFHELPSLLRSGDHLILNNSRVIPARLFLKKPTGGILEFFCLEPAGDHVDFQLAMATKASIEYICLIGGASKWKTGMLTLEVGDLILKADLISRKNEFFHIAFSWEPKEMTFSEVLSRCGELPVPPYFNRKAVLSDSERYQTVYNRFPGSVAAPTAGLHFSDQTFDALRARGIDISYITLHVGAGTFKPVSAENLGDHEMHREYFSIEMDLIDKLKQPHQGRIIVVGTTTLRSLESAYWIGERLNGSDINPHLSQWEAYESIGAKVDEAFSSDQHVLNPHTAFLKLSKYMKEQGLNQFQASTSLMIGPGYKTKVADALLTNFHLPKSSLLVLVSALVGDNWKTIYKHALENNYRFLSYGDASLLWFDAPKSE